MLVLSHAHSTSSTQEPRFFVIDVEYGRRTQDALYNGSTALARSLDDESASARFTEAMRRALEGMLPKRSSLHPFSGCTAIWPRCLARV